MENSSVSKYVDGQMRMRREEGAMPNKKIIFAHIKENNTTWGMLQNLTNH